MRTQKAVLELEGKVLALVQQQRSAAAAHAAALAAKDADMQQLTTVIAGQLRELQARKSSSCISDSLPTL